jgi:hypothetical protein
MEHIAGVVGFVLLVAGGASMLGSYHYAGKLQVMKAEYLQLQADLRETLIALSREGDHCRAARLDLERVTRESRALREEREDTTRQFEGFIKEADARWREERQK